MHAARVVVNSIRSPSGFDFCKVCDSDSDSVGTFWESKSGGGEDAGCIMEGQEGVVGRGVDDGDDEVDRTFVRASISSEVNSLSILGTRFVSLNIVINPFAHSRYSESVANELTNESV